MTNDQPDTPYFDPQAFAHALNQFSKGMQNVAACLRVQGILGALWTGDMDAAARAIGDLPPRMVLPAREAAQAMVDLLDIHAGELGLGGTPELEAGAAVADPENL